jgi:tetratricopeptide (TPR) repeat protein
MDAQPSIKLSSQAALEFLVEVLQRIVDSQGDVRQVYHFLTEHQNQLNETLLEAMPIAASILFKRNINQQEFIAGQFVNLGNFIAQFPLGIRSVNLELAIAAYELALQVYTRETFPEKWAMTQNNLANAYSKSIWGDRADNLERAIAAYELALQVYTREAFPEKWALTQNNLASAYSNPIWSERADNLERVISACELALQIRTLEAFPEQWATTQNNLALAYSKRIRGNRADNLERAICSYELALQIRTLEAFPEDWAKTQGNLAGALMERAQLNNNPSDLDIAIQLLQAALEVAVPNSSYFINDQYSLGNALFYRFEFYQRQSDLEQAVQAYETAFCAISPEHYNMPHYREKVGEAQSVLGGLLVNEGKWRKGLEFLLGSLDKLQQGDDLLAHASALYQAGRANELLSNLDTAATYYRDALRLYQHLGDLNGIARSRERLGGVLVAQGYLEQGAADLQLAKQIYGELDRPASAANLDAILQAAQAILEKQSEALPLNR